MGPGLLRDGLTSGKTWVRQTWRPGHWVSPASVLAGFELEAEERRDRLGRQPGKPVRLLEQYRRLRPDFDVAQLPAHGRDLALVAGEGADELHRDVVAAEPQRAGGMPLGHAFVDRVPGRRDAVDRVVADRMLLQCGAAEEA